MKRRHREAAWAHQVMRARGTVVAIKMGQDRGIISKGQPSEGCASKSGSLKAPRRGGCYPLFYCESEIVDVRLARPTARAGSSYQFFPLGTKDDTIDGLTHLAA